MTLLYGLTYFLLQLGTSISSKRLAVALFLFSYPFLPYYVGLAIGSENQALTFKRLGLIVIFALFAGHSIASSKIRLNGYQAKIIFILFLWLMVPLVGGFANNLALPAIIRGLEFILIAYVGISIGQYIIVNQKFDFFIKYAFILPFLIILPLVFFEFFFQAPIFFDLLGESSQFSDLGARAGFMRYGLIRVQASFADPIEFAEYLVLGLIGCLVFSWERKVLFFGFVFMILASVFATGSRSGLISLVVVLVMFLILKTRYLGLNTKLGLMWIFLSFAFFYGIFTIFSLADFYAVSSFANFDADESSVISRVSQFGYIFAALKDNIVFGLGYQRNFVTSLELVALDNLFLWTLLESGILGLSCFIYLFFIGIFHGVKFIRIGHGEIGKVGVFLVVFFCVYFLQKMLLLSPVNIIYFYIALGMMIEIRYVSSATRQAIVVKKDL